MIMLNLLSDVNTESMTRIFSTAHFFNIEEKFVGFSEYFVISEEQ